MSLSAARCLGVEHVDEAPEHAYALVGELDPVGRDTFDEDAERLADRVGGVFGVPDVAVVELVAPGGCAEDGRVFADGCGSGLSGGLDGGHVDDNKIEIRLISGWRHPESASRAGKVC